jgi:ribosomal protein S4E
VKTVKPETPGKPTEGAQCKVIGSVHTGKSGIVRDIKTSKTGHVTITVVESNGERFKTLLKNVAVQAKSA